MISGSIFAIARHARPFLGPSHSAAAAPSVNTVVRSNLMEQSVYHRHSREGLHIIRSLQYRPMSRFVRLQTKTEISECPSFAKQLEEYFLLLPNDGKPFEAHYVYALDQSHQYVTAHLMLKMSLESTKKIPYDHYYRRKIYHTVMNDKYIADT